MPVRLRITLLFVSLVFVIMGIVCGSIYYFSYRERINTIKTRLTNRAITTGRLFSQREIFDQRMLRQIDSLTSVSLKAKIVQVFDANKQMIYSYSEVAQDSLPVHWSVISRLGKDERYYFRRGKK